MDSMYQAPWVQKLLGQIKDPLKQNSGWFGPDPSKPQRILDSGCGNRTVSSVSNPCAEMAEMDRQKALSSYR